VAVIAPGVENVQASEDAQVTEGQSLGYDNLQVGMVLLPNSLDVRPRF
jgi:hypothetical protein